MARRHQEGACCEGVSACTGATGDAPEARWRRAAARYSKIQDRVVQTAAKVVLEPIFEADLDPAAYGYRPGRSGTDAIKVVHALLCRGYTDVVDADLSKYFDTIPHRELMRSVARRIVDRNVLRLIKLWLTAPVEERDDDGMRRIREASAAAVARRKAGSSARCSPTCTSTAS
jgi:Reverse transcriptase (RNA-dependent DNA polymerase)